MRKYILIIGMIVSSFTFAASDFYERTYRAPNIYGDGGWGTTFFTRPSSVPLNGTSVTNVTWDWGNYTNGAHTQVMELCYRVQYTQIQNPCIDITNAPTGTSNAFNGLSARGSFDLRHTLYGGSYPVYPSHDDYIRVDYDY